MRRLLILYGTTEGQTRKIAEAVARRAGQKGLEVRLHDATDVPNDLDLDGFDAAIVAASVHAGQHQSAVEHFVCDQLGALQALPSAFLSVSLSAAGDADDRRNAVECVERFLDKTGWRPTRTHLVAGAFRYTEYDFFKRWMMKQIARRKGVATDTHWDCELTDWDDLVRFVDEFLALATHAARPALAGSR